ICISKREPSPECRPVIDAAACHPGTSRSIRLRRRRSLFAAKVVRLGAGEVCPVIIDAKGQAVLAAARVVRLTAAPVAVKRSDRPVLIEERSIGPEPRSFGHDV